MVRTSGEDTGFEPRPGKIGRQRNQPGVQERMPAIALAVAKTFSGYLGVLTPSYWNA